MIAFPAGSEIFVVHERVSFARGIDGMCALCRQMLFREPLCAAYFLFLNRARSQVRVLWYDGQGFWLCTKRLSRGTFPIWPKACEGKAGSLVAWHAAQALVAGAACISVVPDWVKISGG